VALLIAKGKFSKEIAKTLSISMHTVYKHRENIYRKMGIRSACELTVCLLVNKGEIICR